MKSVAVYGIGNVLIGDDAVGPTVVSHLTALYDLPSNLVVEDLGTPSLDLAGRLCGFDAVIFVDAVSAKGEPGDLRFYNRAEILKHPPSLRLSPHDPSLKETLLTVELMPDAPTYIRLVGVIPRSLEQFRLSDEVKAAVPRAIEAVLAELEGQGITLTRRVGATVPAAFWDAA